MCDKREQVDINSERWGCVLTPLLLHCRNLDYVLSIMAEQPYKLHISDAEIELLHKKLELVRFPDELEDAGREYGAPLADIQRLVARWKNGYDWRKAESEINKLPQFTRDIKVEGFSMLNIHYIHQKSSNPNAIPLVFVHGCTYSYSASQYL